MGYWNLPKADNDGAVQPARWYVVRTQQRAEKRVEGAIRELMVERPDWADGGLDVYMPALTRYFRHARREVLGQEALFPRYVFVAAPSSASADALHAIRHAEGVEVILGVGGPQAVNYSFVAGIRHRELLGEFDTTRDHKPAAFAPGDKVQVKVGRQAGWPGTVHRMTADKRVEVLLRAFGREHLRTLDVGDLAAA